MKIPDAPIDAETLADIDRLSADIADDHTRNELRRHLLKEAQDEANRHAVNRIRFREGIELAKARGEADTDGCALQRVIDLGIVERHAAQVRAIVKRVDDTNRKHANKLAERLDRASKSAKPSRRRHAQDDRKYVTVLGFAEKEGRLGNVPSVLSEIENKIGTYRLPHWDHTTISLKVMAMSIISAEEGAQTINLHLSPDVEGQAVASPRGPAGYMQDRIRRALAGVFGGVAPEFWFTVESDRKGHFHLHGAVVTPSSPNARKLVDDALRTAGGKWRNGKGQLHQQLSVELLDPIYWASYTLKHLNLSSLDVPGKLFASTRGIRAEAFQRWDTIRAALPQSPRA